MSRPRRAAPGFAKFMNSAVFGGARATKPLSPQMAVEVERTREALAVADDLAALPECERVAFAEVIASRAAEWRRGQAAVWPIVVRIERDPRVRPERY